MFALWYLSLAVDELRKRYGWTFFDIFYKTKKTDTNALDNKPADIAAPKKVEPVQPSISKIAPPATKPAATPSPTPASAPVAPTPSATKPTQAPNPIPTPTAARGPLTPTPPATKPAQAPNPTPVSAPAPVSKPETLPAPKPTTVVEPPKPFVTPLAPSSAPETVAKPELKPANPPSPQKTFGQKLNDSMDRKLMEVSKAKENGESLKNNLKNVTTDFLNGEANARTLVKRK